MTSGNILKIYETKKIKNVNGLMSVDKKTGWLWMLSYIGITAFPPSILFISEFLMIKSMLEQGHYILAGLFLLLLTIILFGLGRNVINMCYGEISEERNRELSNNRNRLKISMYVPQVILLIIAFLLGIYIPYNIEMLIKLSVVGL